MNSSILARKIRYHVLRMVTETRSSHIGSCFSIADILAVLYTNILHIDPKDPKNSDRDRFILSKGHAAAALYAVLAEKEFFPTAYLDSFDEYGAKLLGHCTANVPGIELSTGSLGHGLSVGLGMAKALQLDHIKRRVFVLLGDGECNEGSVWEAALLAPQLKLSNICVIVDYNKIQSFGTVDEVIKLEPFQEKWLSFGWNAVRVNGHDHDQLNSAFQSRTDVKPTVILADTIKGKGVSYMENKLAWHYKSPNAEEYQIALEELGVIS